jgi:hypothetical protein
MSSVNAPTNESPDATSARLALQARLDANQLAGVFAQVSTATPQQVQQQMQAALANPNPPPPIASIPATTAADAAEVP